MNELTPSPTGLALPGRGFEGMRIEKEDLLIPRANLLQALSPEVAEQKFEGARAGLIVNSLTLDLLPARFVPIFCFKNFVRFNPRNRSDTRFDPQYEPGATIWRTNDPDDPRVQEETKWGPKGEKPLATTFMNFFSLFPGVSMPIVIGFAKTSYAAGKELLSHARFSQVDMWKRAYTLSSFHEQNEKGDYYIFAVKAAGLSTTEEQQQAEAWWQGFSVKAAEIKVHEEERGDGDDPTF